MNNQNLRPVKNKKEARERGKVGGLARTPAKRFGALKAKSHKARCKNCKAQCILKKGNIEQKKTMKCPIPEARARAIFYGKPVVDEGILDKLSHTTLFKMMKIADERNDFNCMKEIHKCLLNQKEADYPKVNKNLNLNYGEEVREIKISWVKDE